MQNLLDSLAAFVREFTGEGKKLKTGLATGSLVSVCRERGQKKKQQNTENTVQLSEYYTFCLINITFAISGCFEYCWELFFLLFLVAAESIASSYAPEFLCEVQ